MNRTNPFRYFCVAVLVRLTAALLWQVWTLEGKRVRHFEVSDQPHAVAFDRAGNALLSTDGGVQVYTNEGHFITSFEGAIGRCAVHVDSQWRVYLTSNENTYSRTQVWEY